MADTTVYDVAISYRLDDKASAALAHLGDTAKRTERDVSSVKDGIRTLAEAFLLKEAFAKGKELFVDFNNDMEQIQIRQSAILRANDLAHSFSDAREQAALLTKEFQRFAVTSPVTTKEISAFSAGISTAVAQAGGTISDITNVAEQGIIAAKAFGANAETGALQISEAIQRGAHAREIFTKSLIQTQRITLEEFNALNSQGRLDVIKRALNSDAIKEAATAFGESFEGVTSTLKDNIEITFGKIGLPLFKQITKEVASWNDWIAKNPEKIEAFSKSVSEGLVKGFEFLKSVASFFVDNKDILIKVAELWAGSKVTSAIGDIAGGVGAFGSGLLKSVEDLGDFSGGLASLAGPIALVVKALSLFHWGLTEVAKAFDDRHKERISGEADFRTLHDYLLKGQGNAGAAFIRAREMGLITKEGQVDTAKARREFEALATKGEDSTANLAQVVPMVKALQALVDFTGPEEVQRKLGRSGLPAAPTAETGATKAAPKINVTIHKIEVPAADPDRFVHQMVKKFTDVVKNPAAADRQLTRGF